MRVHQKALRAHKEAVQVHKKTLWVDKKALRVHDVTLRARKEALQVHNVTLRVDRETLRVHREAMRASRKALWSRGLGRWRWQEQAAPPKRRRCGPPSGSEVAPLGTLTPDLMHRHNGGQCDAGARRSGRATSGAVSLIP